MCSSDLFPSHDMAAGNIKIQANDTRIYTLTSEDGAAGNVNLTIPKDGGKLAHPPQTRKRHRFMV